MDKYDIIAQKQKERAIELDTFMRTDKEVQELIKKLPEEDTIEILNNFCGFCEGTESELEMDELSLFCSSDTIEEHYGYNDTVKGIQNANGEIDKKGIISWLNNLIDKVSEIR